MGRREETSLAGGRTPFELVFQEASYAALGVSDGLLFTGLLVEKQEDEEADDNKQDGILSEHFDAILERIKESFILVILHEQEHDNSNTENDPHRINLFEIHNLPQT